MFVGTYFLMWFAPPHDGKLKPQICYHAPACAVASVGFKYALINVAPGLHSLIGFRHLHSLGIKLPFFFAGPSQ